MRPARRREQPRADAVLLGEGRIARALLHCSRYSRWPQEAEGAELDGAEHRGAAGEDAAPALLLLAHAALAAEQARPAAPGGASRSAAFSARRIASCTRVSIRAMPGIQPGREQRAHAWPRRRRSRSASTACSTQWSPPPRRRRRRRRATPRGSSAGRGNGGSGRTPHAGPASTSTPAPSADRVSRSSSTPAGRSRAATWKPGAEHGPEGDAGQRHREDRRRAG